MCTHETLVVKIDRRVGGRNFRQYNVHERISDSGMEIFEFPLNPFLLQDSNVGYIGHNLILKLNDIDGIEQVALKPFCLYVEKNSAFTWKELESDILFTLESAVGKPVVIKVR
ncbi:MAG: hypothetical protein UU64_C0019G0015 [candidate division WWE3 bacterium GW2011_GWF2_41_45]|uniref:Uncharacterized protein n=2 Tax=Katanobacteria TaxID=422282 RepID=A0A0G0VQK1_UNCKA|nr:MAG: hypothetical protein UU55_C0005G0077 [candidate division WWE3 bacterium GW2011_GWC2_41_23]KKS08930.1 MAG: hypothetical protein UU64_C0019G0015 [candidate division WWE3 bacterium GW2011_GWF2_41_45]KKS11834.1 MAG: hypothetical protein UU68_C0010G0015 [candidate division WWE3 bacterium GW2011_GWF1_41_53]KKS19506.1 MAG: hypothetical protein UU79_C0017G0009 [candidate division WWE3 bacterium GW2011_GWE1_41_72]KKS30078.1 MAG: hypothetical protein UU90_C0005G0038 [candidate division WWE3 bacte